MKKKIKSGRPELPIHLYDNDYKFLLTFSNKTECQKYFGIQKGALFLSSNSEFREMPDGTFICKTKLGRDGLKRLKFIRDSKFCKELKSDIPVEIFNVIGEKVGEFRSLRELKEICGMRPGTLQEQFNSDIRENKRVKLRQLYFMVKL